MHFLEENALIDCSFALHQYGKWYSPRSIEGFYQKIDAKQKKRWIRLTPWLRKFVARVSAYYWDGHIFPPPRPKSQTGFSTTPLTY